ncbi:MAG TPA: RNA-binding protein, partial [Kiloniellaceae bacterium]|nr:RNA-binding protein [Kiloniellaceae bacterium]
TGQAPRQPLRRCLASGAVLPKADLLRFAVDPEGQVVPDLGERLPGRGLWLQPRRDMMEKACKKNLFARAAKRQLRVPSDLVEQVELLALRRCLDQLGLARRAGSVVVGFEKVRAALKADRIGLLLQAEDGAADGTDRLRALAQAVGKGTAVQSFCDAAALGTALGRPAAVHVGVMRGRFAAALRGMWSASRVCGAVRIKETGLGAQPKVSARGHDDKQGKRSQAAVEAEPAGQAAAEEDG